MTGNKFESFALDKEITLRVQFANNIMSKTEKF